MISIHTKYQLEGTPYVGIEKGSYFNLLEKTEIIVANGTLKLAKSPLLFWVKK